MSAVGDIRPDGKPKAVKQPRAERATVDGQRAATVADLVALGRRLHGQAEEKGEAEDERLTRIEAAIDRMESRLFIELEPMIEEATEKLAKPVARRSGGITVSILFLLAGILLGMTLSDPLRTVLGNTFSGISLKFIPVGEHSGPPDSL